MSADPSSPIPAALTHLTDTDPLELQDAVAVDGKTLQRMAIRDSVAQ